MKKEEIQTYHLTTFGCQMNEYDSKMIATMLENRGLHEVEDLKEANLVLVNTCSVREKAEDTAFHYIKQLRYLKKRHKLAKIAVIGCMAKNKGEDIPLSLDHVDWVLGPDSYNRIDQILLDEEPATLAENRVRTEFDTHENYLGQFAKTEDSYTAVISVQRGCNRRCSYCIVPFVRGKEKNREEEDVLNEVRSVAHAGIHEVTLLGQTVNSWKQGNRRFSDLLESVASVEGIERVRFTSPHPRHFKEDLIRVMKENPKICRHAHLPMQSGSDSILKDMKRVYSRDEFFAITQALRKDDESFGLTTDIIVGYPGETEQDFEDTLDLVRKIRFDNAFMFAYSPRKGTASFDRHETLSQEEKLKRLNRLVKLQGEITVERQSMLIGSDQEILLEGPSKRNPKEWIGKTECFRKVIVPYKEGMNQGNFLQVHITELRGRTLRGKNNV